MFGGNAKTHFQRLGRGDNATGYMMSPFGDERWDIDDEEKMRKLRQKSGSAQSTRPEPKIPNEHYSRNVINKHMNGKPHQLPPCACDVNLNNSVSDTMTYGQPSNTYSAQYRNAYDQTRNQYPQGKLSQQQMHSSYQYRLADARNNNRTFQYQQQQQQQPSYQYQTPKNYLQHSKPVVMNGLQDVQAEKRGNYICDSCQTASNLRYQQDRTWKSSPDVPIMITSETNYKPLGPMDATPNPFFPPREKNLYAPLN